MAINDTDNAKKKFKKEYFLKRTKGLKDFYKTKINNYGKFAKFVIKQKTFIRKVNKYIIENIKN